ncbi:MAG: hypothetical protein EBS76_11445 [Actinobacteria bacterium]|nr:hypothetical protein [Actinomycetota bacterium]
MLSGPSITPHSWLNSLEPVHSGEDFVRPNVIFGDDLGHLVGLSDVVENHPFEDALSCAQLTTHFFLAVIDFDHDLLKDIGLTAEDEIIVGDVPAEHFVRDDFHRVGVNTDNRLMSAVSPTGELLALHAAHTLTWDDVHQFVSNAIGSGFAPREVRMGVLRDIVDPWFNAAR